MNKKLVVAVALIFGAAGLILAQGTVKAQDVTDNSAMVNSDTGAAMNSDTGAAMNDAAVNDAGAGMNADNTAPAAPEANTAQ